MRVLVFSLSLIVPTAASAQTVPAQPVQGFGIDTVFGIPGSQYGNTCAPQNADFDICANGVGSFAGASYWVDVLQQGLNTNLYNFRVSTADRAIASFVEGGASLQSATGAIVPTAQPISYAIVDAPLSDQDIEDYWTFDLPAARFGGGGQGLGPPVQIPLAAYPIRFVSPDAEAVFGPLMPSAEVDLSVYCGIFNDTPGLVTPNAPNLVINDYSTVWVDGSGVTFHFARSMRDACSDIGSFDVDGDGVVSPNEDLWSYENAFGERIDRGFGRVVSFESSPECANQRSPVGFAGERVCVPDGVEVVSGSEAAVAVLSESGPSIVTRIGYLDQLYLGTSAIVLDPSVFDTDDRVTLRSSTPAGSSSPNACRVEIDNAVVVNAGQFSLFGVVYGLYYGDYSPDLEDGGNPTRYLLRGSNLRARFQRTLIDPDLPPRLQAEGYVPLVPTSLDISDGLDATEIGLATFIRCVRN